MSTHDTYAQRYTEPYRGPVSEAQSAEAASEQKTNVAELLVLLKAHLDFCAKALRFTGTAVDEIRRNLAGTD